MSWDFKRGLIQDLVAHQEHMEEVLPRIALFKQGAKEIMEDKSGINNMSDGNRDETENDLVRADITTKNKAKYEEINKYLDEMEERIKEVAEKEELSKLRPPISGDEIMDMFDLEPGPSVGVIMKALYEQRINDGEVSKEEAIKLAEQVYKKL